MSQGRKALSLKHRQAIRQRLLLHSSARSLTRSQLRAVIGCGDTTVTQWLNPSDPSTPDVVSCVRLAQKEALSLNWLLLGEEPRHRRAVPLSDSLPDQLRAAVVTAVADRIPGSEMLVPDGTLLLAECQHVYGDFADYVLQSRGRIAALVEQPPSDALLTAARRELDAARREARAADFQYRVLSRLVNS